MPMILAPNPKVGQAKMISATIIIKNHFQSPRKSDGKESGSRATNFHIFDLLGLRVDQINVHGTYRCILRKVESIIDSSHLIVGHHVGFHCVTRPNQPILVNIIIQAIS